MRRVLMVVAAVAMCVVGLAGPARADYHALCVGGVGDTHNLTNVGGELRARAQIACGGRTITVQKFEVKNVLTQTVVASLAVPLQCANVCTGDQTQISFPAAAGYYEVSLKFHVSGNGFDNTRQSEWVFTGSGSPQRTCGFNLGGFPVPCV